MVGIKKTIPKMYCTYVCKKVRYQIWTKNKGIFFVSVKNSCGCGSSYIVNVSDVGVFGGFRGCLPFVLSVLRCLNLV